MLREPTPSVPSSDTRTETGAGSAPAVPSWPGWIFQQPPRPTGGTLRDTTLAVPRSRQPDSGVGHFNEARGGWDIPAEFNFTRDVVEALALNSRRRALTSVDADGVIKRATFVEVTREAARWSSVLRARGNAPGDRVIVIVDETSVWLTVMLGVLKAGMIAVPCPRGFADPRPGVPRSRLEGRPHHRRSTRSCRRRPSAVNSRTADGRTEHR